jgi:hypothetical protein
VRHYHFMRQWCSRCERDKLWRDDLGDSCPIVADTMIYDIDEPKYPNEWRYADRGPVCTAFVADAMIAARKDAPA